MKLTKKIVAVLLGSIGIMQTAQATLQTLFETDNDAAAGIEVFGATYDTISDLLSFSASSSGFSVINIAPNYSVAGLAYDGQYQLLIESDSDASAGIELFSATYDTYADVLSGSASSSGFSDINVAPNYSIAGLAYDGQYQLLIESDSDAGAGLELFSATYNTYANLLAGLATSTGFSQINVAPNYSIAGLAFDGQYQLLFETDTDSSAGIEVFSASYATFNDLLSGSATSSGFSNINVAPNYSIAGLAYERVSDPNAVSTPAHLSLMACGFILLFGSRIAISSSQKLRTAKFPR